MKKQIFAVVLLAVGKYKDEIFPISFSNNRVIYTLRWFENLIRWELWHGFSLQSFFSIYLFNFGCEMDLSVFAVALQSDL